MMQVHSILTLAKACPGLSNPYNGKFTDREIHKVNTFVTLTCNVGYEVKGLKTVRCNDSLQWHDPLPTCVGKSQEIL